MPPPHPHLRRIDRDYREKDLWLQHQSHPLRAHSTAKSAVSVVASMQWLQLLSWAPTLRCRRRKHTSRLPDRSPRIPSHHSEFGKKPDDVRFAAQYLLVQGVRAVSDHFRSAVSKPAGPVGRGFADADRDATHSLGSIRLRTVGSIAIDISRCMVGYGPGEIACRAAVILATQDVGVRTFGQSDSALSCDYESNSPLMARGATFPVGHFAERL